MVVASGSMHAEVKEKQDFACEGQVEESTEDVQEGGISNLLHDGENKFIEVGSGKGTVVSGPLFTSKPVVSGPWSSEWLKDHHGEAGIIFTAKKRSSRQVRGRSISCKVAVMVLSEGNVVEIYVTRSIL